jgi:hypothetical protein
MLVFEYKYTYYLFPACWRNITDRGILPFHNYYIYSALYCCILKLLLQYEYVLYMGIWPPFLHSYFWDAKMIRFVQLCWCCQHNILYSTFKDGGKFQLELEILLSNEYVLFLTMSKLQQNFVNNFANMKFSRKFSFSWHVSLTSLAKLIRKVTFSRNSHRKFAFCENHKSQFRFNYTYIQYSCAI